MGTQHQSPGNLASIVLVTPTSEEIVEIEVPAGEHLYLISQHKGDHQYRFHLRQPHSRAVIRGLVEAGKEEDPFLQTEILHHSPHTYADTLIRTVASDKARPRYHGLIRIEKDAQGCESFLSHHTLLLSPQTSSWSIPSLEIFADQVKCSHAATVRTITDQDVFYLRSRGISAKKAQQVLIEAFISDVKLLSKKQQY